MPRELPGSPEPMRESVATPEFEQGEAFEKAIEGLRREAKDPAEHAEIGNQILSELHRDDTTRELKAGLFREAYQQMGVNTGDYNKTLGLKLLSEVSGEKKDSQLRTVYAAILSHELQQEHFPDESLKSTDLQSLRDRISRLDTFVSIAKDESAPKNLREWARMVVEPRGQFAGFVGQYDKQKDSPLRLEIDEEVKDVLPPPFSGTGLPTNLKAAQFENMKLREDFLPNYEKILHWIERTNTYLPVVVQRRAGTSWVTVEAPSDTTKFLNEAAALYREKKINRSQVLGFEQRLLSDVVNRMSPDQRAEFQQAMKTSSVELRFTTEREARHPGKITIGAPTSSLASVTL